MRIDNPAGYAAGVTTTQGAARAAAALEAEVSLGERGESWYTAADTALADLLRRFPKLKQLDAYLQPPSLSPAARRELAAPPVSDQLRAPRPRRRRGLVVELRGASVTALAFWRLARRHPAVTAWSVLVVLAAIAVLVPAPVLLVPVALGGYLLVRHHRRGARPRRRSSGRRGVKR